MAAAPRRVEFEPYQDPFLPDHDQGDPVETDPDWALARRMFLGRALKPSRYTGYFAQSNTLGFVPLGEHNLPSRKRKLWYGHTSFRITGGDEDAVCAVPGVAGYTTLGPYKFMVEVGWLFPDAEVAGNIRAALCPPAPPPPADPLEAGARVFPAWAVVRRGGRRDLVGGLTREEVEGKLIVKQETPEKTSWENLENE